MPQTEPEWVTAITAGCWPALPFFWLMKITPTSRTPFAHLVPADRFQGTGYAAHSIFRARSRRTSGSHLARSVTLAIAAVVLAVLLRQQGWAAHSWLLLLPFVLCLAAVKDAVGSMRLRWDLHHGGVLFLLYADMMLLTLIAVWAIWPA